MLVKNMMAFNNIEEFSLKFYIYSGLKTLKIYAILLKGNENMSGFLTFFSKLCFFIAFHVYYLPDNS